MRYGGLSGVYTRPVITTFKLDKMGALCAHFFLRFDIDTEFCIHMISMNKIDLLKSNALVAAYIVLKG